MVAIKVSGHHRDFVIDLVANFAERAEQTLAKLASTAH
jgi:hypothetical protein